MTVGESEMLTVRTAVDRLLAEHPPASTTHAEFLGARYDAGLAWVHFDPGFGGLGMPASLQSVVTSALEDAAAPDASANYVGVHQAAAAIHAFAGDDLRRRWLRPAFTNEEFWCQLFSEPGAGSDLAGLSTSAARDGEEWIVNGQKVWTSFADHARWAIMLARSDADSPKHRGLTLLVVDMGAEGVEVRPLRTMDGGRHFNEVFLNEVRIPDRYRLGEVGQGWKVSQHLLGSEREGTLEHETLTTWLLDAWNRCPRLGNHEVQRDHVVAAYVAEEAVRTLALRAQQIEGAEGRGAFAPVVKLARNIADQRTASLVVDLLGPEGLLGGEYEWQAQGAAPSEQLRFLRTRAATIGGGTAEIMRNVIGERLLGLPREPRIDRDVPWIETRRS